VNSYGAYQSSHTLKAQRSQDNLKGVGKNMLYRRHQNNAHLALTGELERKTGRPGENRPQIPPRMNIRDNRRVVGKWFRTLPINKIGGKI